MKKMQLPQTDSIEELAQFWDTHDLSDFEDELEEVPEPVFVRGTLLAELRIPLQRQELAELEQLAKAKGIAQDALIREWILEKPHAA